MPPATFQSGTSRRRAVEREYRKEDDAEREEIVARFAERTAEYEADGPSRGPRGSSRSHRRSPEAARREDASSSPLTCLESGSQMA